METGTDCLCKCVLHPFPAPPDKQVYEHKMWERRRHRCLEDRVSRLAAALAAEPGGPDPPLLLEPLPVGLSRPPQPAVQQYEQREAQQVARPQQHVQQAQAVRPQHVRQQQISHVQQAQVLQRQQQQHAQAQQRQQHAQLLQMQQQHAQQRARYQLQQAQQRALAQQRAHAQQGQQHPLLVPGHPVVQQPRQQPRLHGGLVSPTVVHAIEPVKSKVAQLPVSEASRRRRLELLSEYQKMLGTVGE